MDIPKKIGSVLFVCVLALSFPKSAGAAPSKTSEGETSKESVVVDTASQQSQSKAGTFGLTYFSFFDGPGLTGNFGVTPNWLGKPLDDGLSFFNLVSLQYRFSETLAIDLQTRTQILLNNGTDTAQFQQFRWQSPRIGVSGKLLSGEDWSVSGAINTDFPYSFPAPFGGGLLATQRTVVFNPGLFANFRYTPKGTNWSFFTLLTPRYFFYADRDAAEPQLAQGGLSPGLKPELVLQISPSAIYALNEKLGLRFGTIIDFRKLVLSGWNPLSVSLNTSDANSAAWRLWATPIQLGFNYDLSKAFSVYTFLNTYPIAAQRVRRDGTQAGFTETVSVNMWLSGTIF